MLYMYAETQKVMQVPNSTGTGVYDIRLGRDGVAYCTCPQWRYRCAQTRHESGQRGACKHMAAATIVMHTGAERLSPLRRQFLQALEQSCRDNGLLP